MYIGTKIKIPAKFMNRLSCGCDLHTISETDQLKESLMHLPAVSENRAAGDQVFGPIIEALVKTSFKSIASEASLADGKAFYRNLIDLLQQAPKDKVLYAAAHDRVFTLIQQLCDRQGKKNLSLSGLTVGTHRILHAFMDAARDKETMMLYEGILLVMDTYIQSYTMLTGEERINMLLNNSFHPNPHI